MDINYFYFATQREHLPAWNLLCANNAPVILAFVHEAFIKKGRTSAPESELCEILKDLIFQINGGREPNSSSEASTTDFIVKNHAPKFGAEMGIDAISGAFVNAEQSKTSKQDPLESINQSGKGAKLVKKRQLKYASLSLEQDSLRIEQDALNEPQGLSKLMYGHGELANTQIIMTQEPIYYLREWSSESSRYFRCSYLGATGSEPIYDITPDLQKAYSFIVSFKESEKNFVPAESRFKELLSILQEVDMNTSGNSQMYLEQLLAQREALDQEIERAKAGYVPTLSPAQVRERFLQFQRDAIELSDDFRQVEYNLHNLDKEIMQDILNWNGPRGELLDKYFAQNSYIEQTDQGRSVKAFSKLLLSSADDEIIVQQINNLLSRPEIKGLEIDERIKNIHDHWLSLRLNIDRVMGASNKRIKSFLQQNNYDANRFLKERIKSITQKVAVINKEYSLSDLPKNLLEIEVPFAQIDIPFSRPLHKVNEKMVFDTVTKSDNFDIVDDKLFEQIVVDQEQLFGHIEDLMANEDCVSLHEVVKRYPLKHGIAELTTYVKLALNNYKIEEDPQKSDTYQWEAIDPDGNKVVRVATLKKITLHRI